MRIPHNQQHMPTMIIGLYLINNNSPFPECSSRTKQIMLWCVLIAGQIIVIENETSGVAKNQHFQIFVLYKYFMLYK